MKLAVDKEVLQEIFLDKSLGPQSWCGVGINRLGRGFDACNCCHDADCWLLREEKMRFVWKMECDLELLLLN